MIHKKEGERRRNQETTLNKFPTTQQQPAKEQQLYEAKKKQASKKKEVKWTRRQFTGSPKRQKSDKKSYSQSLLVFML